jgi:50S ribosomal protein L16 3-hydroxylase
MDFTQLLGGMSKETFLKEYWHKKPLLIRNAIPNFEAPLSSDDVAGLSLEEAVESRIIIEKGGKHPWEMRTGPFSENTFTKLPKEKWTLLIQGADHWIPELKEILNQFRFIPNWRLDDLMISYAVNGGNVGPHYDNYDVFLLQAEGQRHWHTGQVCDEDTPCIPDTQLRLIENFEQAEDWVLNPGDMLYLPPQMAHHGIAIGECMTYSIGFKAPSKSEVLLNYVERHIERYTQEDRYKDPDLALQPSGLIADQSIDKIQDILKELASDRDAIATWLGEYASEPKYDNIEALDPEVDEQELNSLIDQGAILLCNEASRFCYTSTTQGTTLFVDGLSYPLVADLTSFARQLCDSLILPNPIESDWLSKPLEVKLIIKLINQGALYFAQDD